MSCLLDSLNFGGPIAIIAVDQTVPAHTTFPDFIISPWIFPFILQSSKPFHLALDSISTLAVSVRQLLFVRPSFSPTKDWIYNL